MSQDLPVALPPVLDGIPGDPLSPAAVAKLHRGRLHHDRLALSVMEYMTKRPYETTETTRDGFNWALVLFHEQPPLLDWALTFGEAVQAYRAALDHLTWDLIVRHPWKWDLHVEHVAFPICGDGDNFDAWYDDLGVELDDQLLDTFNAWQPYRDGGALQALAELDAAVHNGVVPVVAWVDHEEHFVRGDRQRRWFDPCAVAVEAVSSIAGATPLAELGHQPEVIVEPRVRSAEGNLPVTHLLDDLYRAVTDAVSAVTAEFTAYERRICG